MRSRRSIIEQGSAVWNRPFLEDRPEERAAVPALTPSGSGEVEVPARMTGKMLRKEIMSTWKPAFRQVQASQTKPLISHKLAQVDSVYCLAFDPSGKRIAVGCANGQVRIVCAESGQVKQKASLPKPLRPRSTQRSPQHTPAREGYSLDGFAIGPERSRSADGPAQVRSADLPARAATVGGVPGQGPVDRGDRVQASNGPTCSSTHMLESAEEDDHLRAERRPFSLHLPPSILEHATSKCQELCADDDT